jgi:DNA-binding MarR family transcriptional regulator
VEYIEVENNRSGLIAQILESDNAVESVLRNSWPEGWLQINLPLGSTRALLAIEGRNARTPGKVADALGVSRTTVTGLLDRLEGEGLVTRAIDPEDRRCFVLSLSQQGRNLINEIYGNRRALIEKALASLSTDDLQALSRGMAALVSAIEGKDAGQR